MLKVGWGGGGFIKDAVELSESVVCFTQYSIDLRAAGYIQSRG